MIEEDTIKLLRECDAGIKMGISSIDEVEKYVKDENMKKVLSVSRDAHDALSAEISEMLTRYGDEGKNPNPIVKGMSWVKTNVKLALSDSDKTIASLMTDGCNMGVKSLSKYLNQYEAAEERAKDITKKLISIEEKMAVELRDYL